MNIKKVFFTIKIFLLLASDDPYLSGCDLDGITGRGIIPASSTNPFPILDPNVSAGSASATPNVSSLHIRQGSPFPSETGTSRRLRYSNAGEERMRSSGK